MHVTAQELYQLAASQEFRDSYTGRPLTPDSAALDHKIPMSRGGEHVLGNLQWINKDVNAAKGTMTHEEFLHMCTEVAERYSRNGNG